MRRLPILITIALLLTAMLAGAARRKAAGPSREDVDKADYVYLEALRAAAAEKYDAAFALLDRARQLNPHDPAIGWELAVYLISLPQGDSVAQATQMMRDYWEANPTDFDRAMQYGVLSERLSNYGDARDVWESLHTLYPRKAVITYRLATLLERSGERADQDRAIQLYDSLEITEGPSTRLASSKITIFLNRGDTVAAIAEADRLHQAQPANNMFTVFAGQVYNLAGQRQRALELLDYAIEKDPSDGLPYYAKALLYSAAKDTVGFDREIYNAMIQENLDIDNKLRLLKSYVDEMISDSTQHPRVRQLFDTLIVQHPLEHDIHMLYAGFLVQTRDYPEAAVQEELTLGLDPADPEGWDMLSSLYATQNHYDKAADALTRAMHYYPDEPGFNIKLGSIYAIDKRYEDALGQYRRAMENTDSANVELLSDIYASMGDAYNAMDSVAKAREVYEKALIYNPANKQAFNNFAYLLACQGWELDRALDLVDRALQGDEDNPTTLDTKAWVLYKLRRYEEARAIQDRVLQLMPEPGEEILEHAGDIYFMLQLPDQALQFWGEALKLDPDNELLKRKVKDKTIYLE